MIINLFHLINVQDGKSNIRTFTYISASCIQRRKRDRSDFIYCFIFYIYIFHFCIYYWCKKYTSFIYLHISSHFYYMDFHNISMIFFYMFSIYSMICQVYRNSESFRIRSKLQVGYRRSHSCI